MRNGFMPVADKGEKQFIIPKRGDIIETFNGEQFVFIDMKRVRWTGKGVKDGKTYGIPLFRDRFKTMPYATKIVGKDKNMELKTGKTVKMTFGQLFSLPQKKETFMYLGDITKRGGKSMIKAVDIATGKGWNIGLECNISKIDLNKLKKESKV